MNENLMMKYLAPLALGVLIGLVSCGQVEESTTPEEKSVNADDGSGPLRHEALEVTEPLIPVLTFSEPSDVTSALDINFPETIQLIRE